MRQGLLNVPSFLGSCEVSAKRKIKPRVAHADPVPRVGWANNRLVDAKVALQHNLGLGGAVVINIYKRADGEANVALSDTEIVDRSAFDYNPATEARHVTAADADKVRSRTARNE